MKISVLGAGAWGTALAMHIAKRHHVALWARDASHISGMQKARSNPKYLGDFNFPKQLELEDSLSKAVNNSDYSYQWIKNSVDIEGATTRLYTATQSGNYSVRIPTSLLNIP